jgi:hypothetical protein
MPRREPLPEDLKELIGLCRAGKLFAVQDWIKSGKRFRNPPGNFNTSPLLASIDKGFHSMVQVLLEAGPDPDELDRALSRSVNDARLDLVELLVAHGADVNSICFDEVLYCRNPILIRWFVDHGIDMEDGYPIAEAFRYKHREFLGIYMGIRDKVPSAKKQVTMALRLHARQANMKWVSLLLWAGADPRMVVPDPEHSQDEDSAGTALEDAVRYGKLDVVRKFGIDPQKDDVTALLRRSSIGTEPEIVKMLLDAGADPNGGTGEESVMARFFWILGWSFDKSLFRTNSLGPALQCIELLAARGGRWRPKDAYAASCFRRVLGKAESSEAVSALVRLVKSGVLEKDVFMELMRTPKMKSLLDSGSTGATFLRECAGLAKK